MQIDEPMETEVSQDTEKNMEIDGANSPHQAAEPFAHRFRGSLYVGTGSCGA